MTIISRPTPTAGASTPAVDVEYGILTNHLAMAIYPDLVCCTATSAATVQQCIADLTGTHPGLECSLMYRAVGGGRWREVGTGRSSRQILAARWHIRIDGGGW